MTDVRKPGSFGAWAELMRSLSLTDSVNRHIGAFQAWFQHASEADRTRAIRLLSGDHPRKLLSKKAMIAIHDERSAWPAWLRESCHAAAPDPCEAIALMEDTTGRAPCTLGLDDLCVSLQEAAAYDAGQKASFVHQYWDVLDQEELFLFNRLATGTFSSGLPRGTWLTAIAGQFGIPVALLSHRLAASSGKDISFHKLIEPGSDHHVLPLPFPTILESREGPEPLAGPWSVHWQRAGQELQLVKRGGTVTLWTREMEPLHDDHPHLVRSGAQLPEGTVLYGRLVIPEEGSAPTRTRTKKNVALQSSLFDVLDLWEWEGKEPIEKDPLQRVNRVKAMLDDQPDHPFRFGEPLSPGDDDALKALHRRSRLASASGLLLLPHGPAGSGPIIHWPAAPHRIKAVLLYAQRADGAQGPQYSFALARGRDWVTVARTGEGLNEKDREELEKFIKANTLQRFGPVRTVKAVQVMELEVDTIRASTRHKSGYLLEGVRIAAWRKDIGTEMVDDLNILNSMKDE